MNATLFRSDPGDGGRRRPGGRASISGGTQPPKVTLVLVVDDDESILGMVSEVLADAGFGVARARNGREALAAVDRELPSIILLDMRMPVMDGWTFAKTLRDRGAAVPVVVMTAAEDARRWAAEIGAEGYLAKPFDLDHLIDAVRKHAGGARRN